MTSWSPAIGLPATRPRAPTRRPPSILPAPASPSPATGRADLDVGYAGRGGAVGLPSRNPIGFAPPADPDRDPAARDPLPHRDLVQASPGRRSRRARAPTSAGSGDEPSPARPIPSGTLPATETEDRQPRRDDTGRGARVVHRGRRDRDEAEASGSSTSLPRRSPDGRRAGCRAAEEKVPFYKRELTFRRRKPEAASHPGSSRGGARDRGGRHGRGGRRGARRWRSP